MSGYIGDFAPGAIAADYFNTNAIAGESIVLATDGTVQVYKDGNTTQSTAGVTFTESFDGLVGVNRVAIDTSADGTFYSAGSDFAVVLSAATIDGKSINAFLFKFSIYNRPALRPTTAGRTLDVSAGGEAGVDWANVGSPTTVVGLSGTTVKTATDVETDTQDLQARTPAALVGGRTDASVGAMANNVLTAAAINADAITAGKVADGTIDAATFAAGAINAAAIATDAITAAKIAPDAIGASELAADAVTEIQTAVAAGAVASVTGAVGSVTGNVGGNVTGSVGSVAAGGITAASFAADAITAAKIAADVGTEIATAVWANGTRTLTSLSALAADIAAAVWNAVATSYNVALSMGNKLNAAGSAGDPWTTVLPGAYGAGTAGKIVGDNVNATISSRASQASLDTVDDFLDTEVAAIKAKTDNLPASPAAVGSAMTLDLTQAIPDNPTDGTVGDALQAAEAQGFGKWTLVGTTLTVYRHDGVTVARVFTLDSGVAPTSRT